MVFILIVFIGVPLSMRYYNAWQNRRGLKGLLPIAMFYYPTAVVEF